MSNEADLDLSGRRAVVTGASRGIGLAIAQRLSRNGAKVALVSRTKEALEEAAAGLAGESIVVQANMSRSEDIEKIVPAVCKAWGGVDILVNNAASNPVFGPLAELDLAPWEKVMGTNVTGPFLLTKAAAASMLERGAGAIVNIASIGGLEPSYGLGAYAISKAAVIHMTKAFALELGPKGIRVNCIAPGLVETKFAELLIKTPSIHEASISRAALRRHGQPEEIAGAAHFLASDASAYMTGQVMVIDGGVRL